jgi:hypothetical protein
VAQLANVGAALVNIDVNSKMIEPDAAGAEHGKPF